MTLTESFSFALPAAALIIILAVCVAGIAQELRNRPKARIRSAYLARVR